MQDVELGGQQLRKGDYVAVFQPSANRDAEAFPDPFRFDVARKDSPIVTFGHGAHLCLGAHFARLELKVFFRRLLERMPDIAPAGPMERGLGFTVLLSPIHQQPVTFTPGPRVLS
jgi:cytochrome P450